MHTTAGQEECHLGGRYLNWSLWLWCVEQHIGFTKVDEKTKTRETYSLISKLLPQRALSWPLLELKTEARETSLFSGIKFYVKEGISSLHLERHLLSTFCIPAGENASVRCIQLSLGSALPESYIQVVPDSVSWCWVPLTEVLYISLWLMQRSRVLACCPLTGFQKY